MRTEETDKFGSVSTSSRSSPYSVSLGGGSVIELVSSALALEVSVG